MAPFNDDGHAEFEAEIAEHLEDAGFIVPPALTYHERWSERDAAVLKRCWGPTALHIRGAPDLAAIHPELRFALEIEAKTCPTYADVAFEVLPAIHHLQASRQNVRILYAVRNAPLGRDLGFLLNDDAAKLIDRVMVPPKCNFRDVVTVVDACRCELPHARIVQRHGKGSGDIFAIIDEAQARALPDWRDVIAGIVAEEREALPTRRQKDERRQKGGADATAA